MVDINALDQEDSTSIVIALKNKHIDIAKYFLKNFSESLDIVPRSKKFGNAINLAIKVQDFEIIDYMLNHKQINSTDSYILNYIIPNFEKNPTENAKYMVKLLLE